MRCVARGRRTTRRRDLGVQGWRWAWARDVCSWSSRWTPMPPGSVSGGSSRGIGAAGEAGGGAGAAAYGGTKRQCYMAAGVLR